MNTGKNIHVSEFYFTNNFPYTEKTDLSPSTDATIYTYTAQMPFRWPTCETLPHFHGFVREMVKILAPLTQENLIITEKINVFPNDYKNVT